MKLIDADYVISRLEERFGGKHLSFTLDNIIHILRKAPAVEPVQRVADVVEVVRCKDCLYNENGTCVHSESYDDTTHRPDYFCADGLRKEDENVKP